MNPKILSSRCLVVVLLSIGCAGALAGCSSTSGDTAADTGPAAGAAGSPDDGGAGEAPPTEGSEGQPGGGPGDPEGTEGAPAAASDAGGGVPADGGGEAYEPGAGSGLDGGAGEADAGPDGGGMVPEIPPPELDECITAPGPGEMRLQCGGIVFDVSVPDACLYKVCGLIFDVHGLTMSAQMQENNTALRELGREHGYIVVQPNANPEPPSSNWVGTRDDPTIYDFLLRVQKAWHVDAKRIHFTGFSQGGNMTWRFLCAHAELFASVAPAAEGSGCFSNGTGPAARPPILYMHGEIDNLVPFSAALAQRDAVVAAWELAEDAVISEDENHKRTRYRGSGGEWFEFLQHRYTARDPTLGSHCYPGSLDKKSQVKGQLFGFACQPPNAFIWGEEVIRFFIGHPKP